MQQMQDGRFVHLRVRTKPIITYLCNQHVSVLRIHLLRTVRARLPSSFQFQMPTKQKQRCRCSAAGGTDSRTRTLLGYGSLEGKKKKPASTSRASSATRPRHSEQLDPRKATYRAHHICLHASGNPRAAGNGIDRCVEPAKELGEVDGERLDYLQRDPKYNTHFIFV